MHTCTAIDRSDQVVDIIKSINAMEQKIKENDQHVNRLIQSKKQVQLFPSLDISSNQDITSLTNHLLNAIK